ncbi:uncharacterized protein BJ171DRAFT_526779 [Polychytrium aggregatum]|uniref:uncharacterized protein n=1 Tax=Polychytrium aggregatum TaxID=110093 RepID=UPI0022FDD473|nr:uncharacterized protein BJ171DRAFT_526779 [Polychytrium aggregatum]KAI9193480.1 hypothetical protein BJ171DRAFT_526779 [Polychytrium aggregatum]
MRILTRPAIRPAARPATWLALPKPPIRCRSAVAQSFSTPHRIYPWHTSDQPRVISVQDRAPRSLSEAGSALINWITNSSVVFLTEFAVSSYYTNIFKDTSMMSSSNMPPEFLPNAARSFETFASVLGSWTSDPQGPDAKLYEQAVQRMVTPELFRRLKREQDALVAHRQAANISVTDILDCRESRTEIRLGEPAPALARTLTNCNPYHRLYKYGKSHVYYTYHSVGFLCSAADWAKRKEGVPLHEIFGAAIEEGATLLVEVAINAQVEFSQSADPRAADTRSSITVEPPDALSSQSPDPNPSDSAEAFVSDSRRREVLVLLESNHIPRSHLVDNSGDAADSIVWKIADIDYLLESSRFNQYVLGNALKVLKR